MSQHLAMLCQSICAENTRANSAWVFCSANGCPSVNTIFPARSVFSLDEKGEDTMDSAASRIVKARQYAMERDRRVKVHSFEVELHGEHSNHLVSYDRGDWHCDCEESLLQGACAHIVAMERILGDSVEPAVMPMPARMDAAASRLVKARQYADERDQRMKVHSFEVELHGEHSNHTITYDDGDWECDCEEFVLRGVCPHVMAMEEILGSTVEPAVLAMPVAA
jgi:hypothetical protein